MQRLQIQQPTLVMVVAVLALAILACSSTPASTLNEGKGTRNDPVAARVYTRTSDYDVRAQAVSQVESEQPENASDRYMKVQFQIRCRKGPDDICNLTEIRDVLKVVSSSGIIFDPVFNVTLPPSDKPLQGRILGGAEQTGWLVYQVPTGLEITLGMAEYGTDRRAFFRLP